MKQRFSYFFFLFSLVLLSLSLWFGPAEAAVNQPASDSPTDFPVLQFLRENCARSDAEACFSLGQLYLELGRKSAAKAGMWKACKLGHEGACSLKQKI